jgi:hypothetical protein
MILETPSLQPYISTMILVIALVITHVSGAPCISNQVRQILPTSTITIAAPTTTAEPVGDIKYTGSLGLKIGLALAAIIVCGALLGLLTWHLFFRGGKKNATCPTHATSYKLRDMGERNGGGAGRFWPQPSHTAQTARDEESNAKEQRKPFVRVFPSVYQGGSRSPIDWAEYDRQVEEAREQARKDRKARSEVS